MDRKKNILLRKSAATLMLALFILQMPLPALAAAGRVTVNAPLKNELALEDIDAQKESLKKPNVLFLIEATAAMASTPKGVVPQVWRDSRWDDSYWESAEWTMTKEKFGYTIYDINRMMEDFTFGMGALPVAWRGGDLRPERNLYGRERDESNNFKQGGNLSEDIELNKDNYYFPFLEANNALVGLYSSQRKPLEVGFTNTPELWPDRVQYGRYTFLSNYCSVGHPASDWGDGVGLKIGYTSRKPVIGNDGNVHWPDNNKNWYNEKTKRFEDTGMRFQGDEQVRYYNYSLTNDYQSFPYALVFKDPKYWHSGWAGPGKPGPDDLVPNDSRMYQTKLVLWNLLKNEDLFKSFRFGMATTFLSPANVEIGTYGYTHCGIGHPRQDINGIFKVAPFSANVKTKSYFNRNGDVFPSMAMKETVARNINLKVPDGYTRVRYENGAMYGPTTGEIECFFTIHGQYYPVWHNATVHSNYATMSGDKSEPDGWYFNDEKNRKDGNSQGERFDRKLYKLMNRASLHMPILNYDHKWTKGGRTITHIDKFKMWINGIADIRSAGTYKTDKYSEKSTNHTALTEANRMNQFHYYNDPEIGVAGVFALPQAIFPDPTHQHSTTEQVLNLSRSYYINNAWVWYSMRDYNINYRADFRRGSDEIETSGIPRARFNSGSGEATGSVLDFFSPKISYSIAPPITKTDELERYGDQTAYVQVRNSNTRANGTIRATVTINDLDDVSFPIRNKCEDNWLVVIASGAEPKIADSSVYSYSAWEAVKNLYDSTDASKANSVILSTGVRKVPYEKVTMMTKDRQGIRHLSQIDLDKPIRTLVIGIVADENDPDVKNNPRVLAEVKRMRLNLVRMAVAGQGEDASKITYSNMYNAPYQPFFADNVASLQIAIQNALTFVSEAREPQQSKGALVEIKADPSGGEHGFLSATYRVVNNNQWEGTLKRYRTVKSGDRIVSLDASASWELSGKLKNKRDSGGLNVAHWDGASQKFVPLTASDASGRDIFGLSGVMLTDPKTNVSYSSALHKWVQGYDYSYLNGHEYPRGSLLADFGQSSVAVVAKPAVSADYLPGFKAWAALEAARNNPPMLYTQTNDGILHVVDLKSGSEKKTILLPQVLLPTRLAALKTIPAGAGKLSWMNVTAPEGRDGSKRSAAGFTLDGPLQVSRFRGVTQVSDWGTYLLGTLGRGGNGLYMLDVSSYDNPKFMWFHERYGDQMISMSPGMAAPKYEVASQAAHPGYFKLGYNSPKPVTGVVMIPGKDAAGNQNTRNFIALSGGVQTELNISENGKEGAVLLILDPKDGSVIQAFDSGSIESGFRVGGAETGEAPYMGMMVSEPTLCVAGAGNSNIAMFATGRIYAADNRGNIFAALFEEADGSGGVTPMQPSNWKLRTVATLQSSLSSATTSQLNYAIPYGVVLMKNGSTMWVAGGTSDTAVRKSSPSNSGIMPNHSQMIFSFKTHDSQAKPLALSDLHRLDITQGSVMPANGKGWFIPLEVNRYNFAEYISAKPTLVNGVLFVPTFTMTKLEITDADDLCKASSKGVNGFSRLYALDIENGGAKLWTSSDADKKSKYIQIEGVKLTGLTRVRGNNRKDGKATLLATFENLTGDKIKDLGQENANLVKGLGAIEITPPASKGKGRDRLKPGQSVPVYWLIK
ncbi:MAG: pilus assembly protein [Synergistaceae bacterium]|nr:pilus assembly protein [Synergistaceae bacterium]